MNQKIHMASPLDDKWKISPQKTKTSRKLFSAFVALDVFAFWDVSVCGGLVELAAAVRALDVV